MQEKYGEKGFRVVAVNAWDEPRDQIQDFVNEKKLPYIVLLNGSEVFKKVYLGRRIPHSYIIDHSGEIVYSHIGWEEDSLEEFTHQIEQLLAKKEEP